MTSIVTRFLLCLLFLTTAVTGWCQPSSLVIFTQENQPFTVVLNGIQQNPDPETNVRITGLKSPDYKVKVIFSDKTMKDVDKTVYLQPESETTYEILKNSKGIWVMRLLNTIPADEAPEQVKNQHEYSYSTTPRQQSSTTSQSTTVSTVLPGGVTISTSTTHSATSVSTGVSAGAPMDDEEAFRRDYPDYPLYDGPTGCRHPMGRSAFDQAVQSINAKDFESTRLTIAKQVITSNCLLSRQVREILGLFSFESSRLEFAKYAYKYTWDVNNYFILNDAFDFESSVDELNRYINISR